MPPDKTSLYVDFLIFVEIVSSCVRAVCESNTWACDNYLIKQAFQRGT